MSFSSITVILLLIFVWFVTYINILKLTTIKHIHFRLDSSYYMITIIFFCLNSDTISFIVNCREHGGSASTKGIQNSVLNKRKHPDESISKFQRKRRRMPISC